VLFRCVVFETLVPKSWSITLLNYMTISNLYLKTEPVKCNSKDLTYCTGAGENQHHKLFTISQRGNSKFEFLGFEFRWGVSAKVEDIIKRRTAPGKLSFKSSTTSL